ncbi:MAG: class II aldolase/adducin family protein [Bacteroidales bacterium]
MLNKLREEVYQANIELVQKGLVIVTWGNASGYDPDSGYIIIKPSGLSAGRMTPGNMVIIDMNGKIIEGDLKPSSDAKTHIELYRKFNGIKGVVHTHSRYATAWVQAGRDIPVPWVQLMPTIFMAIFPAQGLTEVEVKDGYELNTGLVICERFKNIDYKSIPAVLVKEHGPFCWGESPSDAVENAVVLGGGSKNGFNNRITWGYG